MKLWKQIIIEKGDQFDEKLYLGNSKHYEWVIPYQITQNS